MLTNVDIGCKKYVLSLNMYVFKTESNKVYVKCRICQLQDINYDIVWRSMKRSVLVNCYNLGEIVSQFVSRKHEL